ncbi:hypothetical protein TSUD_47250 [Trifolium subterraneum]|nr:hypothetical protein TSUD_47250 [Trifolium subterraneum]
MLSSPATGTAISGNIASISGNLSGDLVSISPSMNTTPMSPSFFPFSGDRRRCRWVVGGVRVRDRERV